MTAPSQMNTARSDSASIGQLIDNISEDLSRLLRQELELAKAEMRTEAAKAGKAAGMLGGASFAAYLAVVLLSFAAVFALANVMDAGWAALIIAVVWGIVAAVLYRSGRTQLRTVSPVPQQTMETLKEDARWLKNPTG